MKIAVISAHTGSLVWFRLDMMKDFIANGHDVLAIGPDPSSAATRQLTHAGISYHQVPVERNGVNPLKDIRYAARLYALLRRERPDKLFLYQAKPVVYGAIAARCVGITGVYALIAGLGSVFRGQSPRARLVKAVMTAQYWIAARCTERMFFQNADDLREFTRRGLIEESRTVVINGSGVNLQRFKMAPVPANAAILFIGRLIKDKGVGEYLEACREIRRRQPSVRCMLIGPFDTNPTALTSEELQPFIESGIVEYFGEQSDVRPFIEQSSIYVLPSYHEGTPKTVLEAMAMGRPVITTDAPGCRETVRDGLNGLLVPPRDVAALVDAILRLVIDRVESERMGQHGRRWAESKYDVRLVNHRIMETMGLSVPVSEEF